MVLMNFSRRLATPKFKCDKYVMQNFPQILTNRLRRFAFMHFNIYGYSP